MRGNQMPGFEDVPEGIGDEVGLLGARVAAQFFVDARENNLPPCPVPLNGHAAVGLVPGGIENHRAARVVVSHDQVEHGGIQSAVDPVGMKRGRYR